MADQNPTNARPQVLQLYLSPEEATLILNKMNTADFKGFGEATMAVTILGKIRGANQIPVAGPGPSSEQMTAIRNAPPSSPDAVKEALSPKKFRSVPKREDFQEKHEEVPTVGPSVSKTEESEHIEDEKKVQEVDEDTRPTAPLKPLEESKASSESKEDVPPPPEDAGIFSVIDRTKVSGSEKEYV